MFSKSQSGTTITKLSRENLNIYPNPAQNRLTLQAEIDEPQNVYIEILSTNGNVIKSTFVEKQPTIQKQRSVIDIPTS